ncbi:aldo/keto reductase [Bradyrhizobium sp. LHD-71]|uniref:aldo/keto reductase n=1 Tax=Bradyrhizobium sp. LHD-71 TaxID=3072141 RepID=UPI00280FB7B0|nr:aldo/keto reductase [Bradyrhizobium sp. LHD-71]MDQ8727951.1 aldo/keto reductase [Bradyrhizobium sp. LHD-71]
METRLFGRSGLKVSLLGFGCGAVGGLMVRGTREDQERAFVRAIEAGITYFDTAAIYGDGISEQTLGRLVRQFKPRDFIYGTKVRVSAAEKGDLRSAINVSVDASLKRLGLARADILHLHNPITNDGTGNSLTAEQVLQEVVPAFDALRQQGKIGFIGITATGDTSALLKVIDAGAFDSAQVSYNMLNPSAGEMLPPNYPAQDYERLFQHTAAAGTGVIGIRTLAGGALSGSAERQPNASPPPPPIGSATNFDGDVARARRFLPLVDEGFATSLAELATRFVISCPTIAVRRTASLRSPMGTALMGLATLSDLDQAIAAVEKGPLPAATLARIAAVQSSFSGETR